VPAAATTLPRSASDRRFGFKANGLVRILLGAKTKEVKTALERLGLELPNGGILGSLREIFDDLFGPLFAIRELTSKVLDLIFGPVGVNKAKTQIQELTLALSEADNDVRMITRVLRTFPNAPIPLTEAIQIAGALLSDILRAQAILRDAGANLDETANEAEVLRSNLEDAQSEEEETLLDFEEKLSESPATTSTI